MHEKTFWKKKKISTRIDFLGISQYLETISSDKKVTKNIPVLFEYFDLGIKEIGDRLGTFSGTF
jgi:hypothetical protein